MNKTLPIELMNIIFSYVSSPVAVLFKQEMNIYNNEYYKINEGDYEYDMNDFTYAESNSFSYFFLNYSSSLLGLFYFVPFIYNSFSRNIIIFKYIMWVIYCI